MIDEKKTTRSTNLSKTKETDVIIKSVVKPTTKAAQPVKKTKVNESNQSKMPAILRSKLVDQATKIVKPVRTNKAKNTIKKNKVTQEKTVPSVDKSQSVVGAPLANLSCEPAPSVSPVVVAVPVEQKVTVSAASSWAPQNQPNVASDKKDIVKKRKPSTHKAKDINSGEKKGFWAKLTGWFRGKK